MEPIMRRMTTTKLIGLVPVITLLACGAARAGDDHPSLDQLTRYFERMDTATVVSGDAKDTNAVTQIIDPWPRYARDRRIPVNGQRMVGAINRYQNPKPPGSEGANPGANHTADLTRRRRRPRGRRGGRWVRTVAARGRLARGSEPARWFSGFDSPKPRAPNA